MIKRLVVTCLGIIVVCAVALATTANVTVTDNGQTKYSYTGVFNKYVPELNCTVEIPSFMK